MTEMLKETLRGLLVVGEALASHAEKNRLITIVRKGTMSQKHWKRVPQQLASGLCNTDVHFLPEHPDLIILVACGRFATHVSQVDVYHVISMGSQVTQVVGENHPEIPFNISVLNPSSHQIFPSVRG